MMCAIRERALQFPVRVSLENPLWARSERGCTALSKKSSSPSFKANLRKWRSALRKLAEADHLYREIRVENVVTDENGEKASLKPGAKVDLVVEADSNATVKKPQNS